jgi:hypothetical protein
MEELKNFEGAPARAGGPLELETPLARNINRTYSKTMRAAFEKVEKARADGFSFTRIYAAFEKAGLLPYQAHPHSFRQAFYREAERRDREKELMRLIKNDATTSKKETIPVPPKTEPVKMNPAADLTEGIKSLTGSKEEMGLGTLTRYSDGSFDFDWKR